MNSSTTEYSFVGDMVLLLREHAAEIKQGALADTDFEKGRLFGYYEVLSLIQQQARVFGINAAEISMADFDADTDIL